MLQRNVKFTIELGNALALLEIDQHETARRYQCGYRPKDMSWLIKQFVQWFGRDPDTLELDALVGSFTSSKGFELQRVRSM